MLVMLGHNNWYIIMYIYRSLSLLNNFGILIFSIVCEIEMFIDILMALDFYFISVVNIFYSHLVHTIDFKGKMTSISYN